MVTLQHNSVMVKVAEKLPEWANVKGIIWPKHLALEQCSSEQTAKCKATVVSKIKNRKSFIDLTGGFGVDCYYIGQSFEKVTYIEQNQDLAEIAGRNFQELGFCKCNVLNCNSIDYLEDVEHVDLIYIDPARRDVNGRRTYDIEDCTPDLKQIWQSLTQKADNILVKLSPMFDWHKAIIDLPGITEVHIVSVKNECKELLLLFEKSTKPLTLVCANDNDTFIVNDFKQNSVTAFDEAGIGTFLYEPNASIMKAGCFAELIKAFPVSKIGPNSHLFLSNEKIDDFPGRKFKILTVSSMNKQELKLNFKDIRQANITTRNFPMKPEELRKKLKLLEGGDLYIFATTTLNKKHLLYICRKL